MKKAILVLVGLAGLGLTIWALARREEVVEDLAPKDILCLPFLQQLSERRPSNLEIWTAADWNEKLKRSSEPLGGPHFDGVALFGELNGMPAGTVKIVPLSGDRTLLGAIACAGLGEESDGRCGTVFRRGMESEALFRKVAILSNLSRFLKGKGADQNIPLQDGDFIFVPARHGRVGKGSEVNWEALLDCLCGDKPFEDCLRRMSGLR